MALDGKTLRGACDQSHARQFVTVFGHHSNVVMNQVEVANKASEMNAVKPLLDLLLIAGRVVTVKDNQPALKADIARLQMEASPLRMKRWTRRMVEWKFDASGPALSSTST